MVYVSYSWNSLNLLGTFNVRTNSLTIKLMKLELRKNEYIIWFLELQQLHSTMYISTVFELFFCKKKVPYSQHVGLCFPWIVGWLDQQCMYFRPIRLKLLWTTNRIVACNHICWHPLNLLRQDGWESSGLSHCLTKDYDLGYF